MSASRKRCILVGDCESEIPELISDLVERPVKESEGKDKTKKDR